MVVCFVEGMLVFRFISVAQTAALFWYLSGLLGRPTPLPHRPQLVKTYT